MKHTARRVLCLTLKAERTRPASEASGSEDPSQSLWVSLRYRLHLAIERHEQHLDFKLRMFFVNHALELLELGSVCISLFLGVFDVLGAKNDLVRPAVAMIHDYDHVYVVKLDRN